METALFITTESEEPDLLLSFALQDELTGVRSLILQRTPPYEMLLDEHERGVRVSMEGEDEGCDNLLEGVTVEPGVVRVSTQRGEYEIDVSGMESSDIDDMLELLQRMNFDAAFQIDVLD